WARFRWCRASARPPTAVSRSASRCPTVRKPRRFLIWRRRWLRLSKRPANPRPESLSSQRDVAVAQPVLGDVIFAERLLPAAAIQMEFRIAGKGAMHFRQLDTRGQRQGALINLRATDHHHRAGGARGGLAQRTGRHRALALPV